MEKRVITKAETMEKGTLELADGRGRLVWFVGKHLGDSPINMLHAYVKGATVGRPPQQWHDFEEIIHMLKGEMTEFIDGEPYPLKPGDTVLIPAGAKHYTLATNDDEREFVIAFNTPQYVVNFDEEDGSVTTLTLQELLATNK
ncbi:MAG: cupin domain-containing protein [Chloroflexota bacterium]